MNTNSNIHAAALKEIAQDWEETKAWEESVRDCSSEEAKALADEHEEYQEIKK